jgi:hypothetical protein
MAFQHLQAFAGFFLIPHNHPSSKTSLAILQKLFTLK